MEKYTAFDGPREISGGISERISFGDLRVELTCGAEASRVRSAFARGDQEAKIKEAKWQDWSGSARDTSLLITVAPPDLPLSMRLSNQLVLEPGSHALVPVSLPLWLRAGNGDESLFDLPAERLTKSWFGDPVNGEICYTVRNALAPPPPHRFRCHVHITNQAAEQLKIEKLCLRTEGMAIYESGDEYRSNDVQITFRGADAHSDMVWLNQPPTPDHRLVSSCRNDKAEGTLLKGLNTFVDFRWQRQ